MKRLLLGLTMMLVMNVAIGSAETRPVQFQASGSFIVDGDGVTPDLFITSGKDNLVGPFTNQTVAEWGPPEPGEAPDCVPSALFKRALVSGAFVTRAEDGDLIFGSVTSGVNCVGFDGTAHITAEAEYTGGTGRFIGAAGTVTIRATATPLLPSGQFGSVVSEGEGTLTK